MMNRNRIEWKSWKYIVQCTYIQGRKKRKNHLLSSINFWLYCIYSPSLCTLLCVVWLYFHCSIDFFFRFSSFISLFMSSSSFFFRCCCAYQFFCYETCSHGSKKSDNGVKESKKKSHQNEAVVMLYDNNTTTFLSDILWME